MLDLGPRLPYYQPVRPGGALSSRTLERELPPDPRHALDDISGPGQEAPRWRERQVTALAEVALRGLHDAGLDGTLAFAAERLRMALDCDFTKIIDARSSASGLVVRAGSGWPDGVVGNAEVPKGSKSQAGHTIETGSPVIVQDTHTEQRFETAQLLVDRGVRSGVSVLIGSAPDVYGVLQADSRRSGRFDEDDIAVTQAYANVISIVIQRHERDQLSAEFSAIAAHELRTPLTLLLGHSARLLRRLDETGSIDVDQRDEVEAVYVSTLRLQRAVDMFLALGEVERRSGQLVSADVDLVALIDSTIGEIVARYPQADLRRDIPSGPLVRMIDETVVQRVISNLLENAVKYSPSGAPIRVRLESSTGDDVAIHVTDHCGGLSAGDLRQLFRHHFRGETSAAEKGLGLGLYVSQRLVERVGGTLSATNRDGGCDFVLWLPGNADEQPSSVGTNEQS